MSGVQPGAGLGYTGQQADAETGWEYLRARDYSPTLGRFVSEDSVVPNAAGTQGYNLYAYVANNPTRWADLSGHGVPLDLINQIGTARALEAACFSTPWCTALVAELTYQYLKDVAEVWPSGTGVTLATLGFFIGLVYVGVACLIDVTSGPDHLNHCFYTDGQTTTLTGSTGPCSPVPAAPSPPTLDSASVGPSSKTCGAGATSGGGCQYQGGAPPDSAGQKVHILRRRRRDSEEPGGKFDKNEWGNRNRGIYGYIVAGATSKKGPWAVQGDKCVGAFQFASVIGWSTKTGRNRNPQHGDTKCILIIIVNNRQGTLWNAYPIADAGAGLCKDNDGRIYTAT